MMLGQKARILVTYAMPYEINENGKTSKGCTVQFFFFGENGETFDSTADYALGIDGSVGIQRAKASVDYDMKQKIRRVPAVYDADFTMTVGSDGKPVSKLLDLEYIAPVRLEMIAHPNEVPFNDTKEDKAKN